MSLHISINGKNFEALVAGKTVEVDVMDVEFGDRKAVLALNDIGHDKMFEAVLAAGNERVDALCEQDAFVRAVHAMEEYGGSFVQQLAQTAWRADMVTRRKLVLLFMPYFDAYPRR